MAPPRAAFVDYRLGHTSGKCLDRDDQRAVVEGALDLLATATAPGTVVDLGRVWSGDESWREHPLSSGSSGGDGRGGRSPEPTYQCEADRLLALEHHRRGGCGACVGAEPPPPLTRPG